MTTAVSKPFKSLGGFDAGSGNVQIAVDSYARFGTGASLFTIKQATLITSLTSNTGIGITADGLFSITAPDSSSLDLRGGTVNLYGASGLSVGKFDGTNNKSYATTHTFRDAADSTSFLTINSSTVTLGSAVNLSIAASHYAYFGNTSTGGRIFDNGTDTYVEAQGHPLTLTSSLDNVTVAAGTGKTIFFTVGGVTLASITSTGLTVAALSSTIHDKQYIANAATSTDGTLLNYDPATYSGCIIKIKATQGSGATSKMQYSEITLTNNSNGISSVVTITESNYVDTHGTLCTYSADINNDVPNKIALRASYSGVSTVIKAEVTYLKL